MIVHQFRVRWKETQSIRTNTTLQKTTEKGLNPQDIAELVLKVLTVKNPELSYNIGKDSVFARLMSYLPVKISNSLVKAGLKNRIG